MPVLGANLHLFEGIADIGVSHFVEAHGIGIVRLNRDYVDAAFLIIRCDLPDTSFIELRRWTVIADEGDH